MTRNPEPIRGMKLDAGEVERASGWRFNCGPGAICAALRMTPEELRPKLLDFESKGYTNPMLMLAVLKGLNVKHSVAHGDNPQNKAMPEFGLARIQWGGPWTAPGVPMQARYRRTHWVAAEKLADGWAIFDVNAVSACGGWLWYQEWAFQLIPWLIKAAKIKRADGTWWVTHCIELL